VYISDLCKHVVTLECWQATWSLDVVGVYRQPCIVFDITTIFREC